MNYQTDTRAWARDQVTILRRLADGKPAGEEPDWENIITEIAGVWRPRSKPTKGVLVQKGSTAMSPEEFSTALDTLQLHAASAAEVFDVDEAQVKRWMSGESPIQFALTMLVKLLLDKTIKPETLKGTSAKMTGDEYRNALEELGMSQLFAAELFDVDPRTSRRWALGERRIQPAVVQLLNLLLTKKIAKGAIWKVD